MLSTKPAAPVGLGSRGLAVRVPTFTGSAAAMPARRVVVRFKEDDERDRQYYMQQTGRSATDTKLSQEQIDEIYSKKEGEFSRRTAEMRADMGSAAADLHTMQTFDGPGPETINGRLAMLGALTGLIGEFWTGQGLAQQTADHPIVVFASFVIISIATYVPIIKGYTRKEPFANSFLDLAWTPRAENWNGRLAMMGFAGMVLTEWLSGMNTVQMWTGAFASVMQAFGAPPTNIPGM